MDRGHSHLHTFDVRWIEALSSQPYGHQNDDRLPGLVAQRIRGRLARCGVTQVHHILLVHYRSQGKRIILNHQMSESWKSECVFYRSPVQSWATYTTRLWTAVALATAFLEQEHNSDSYTDGKCQMQICPQSGEKPTDVSLY